MQITTSGLHYEKMVKYDNWCIDRSLCDKSTKIGTNDCYHIEYRLIKYPLSIQDDRQRSKMAATKSSVLTFQHQTSVISRASSRSPCSYLLLLHNTTQTSKSQPSLDLSHCTEAPLCLHICDLFSFTLVACSLL